VDEIENGQLCVGISFGPSYQGVNLMEPSPNLITVATFSVNIDFLRRNFTFKQIPA